MRPGTVWMLWTIFLYQGVAKGQSAHSLDGTITLLCDAPPERLTLTAPGKNCQAFQFAQIPPFTPFVFSFRDAAAPPPKEANMYVVATLQAKEGSRLQEEEYLPGYRRQDVWLQPTDAGALLTLCLMSNTVVGHRTLYVQLYAPVEAPSSEAQLLLGLYESRLYRWMPSVGETEYQGPSLIRASRCSASEVSLSVTTQVFVQLPYSNQSLPVNLWSDAALAPHQCGEELEEGQQYRTQRRIRNGGNKQSMELPLLPDKGERPVSLEEEKEGEEEEETQGGARSPVVLSGQYSQLSGRVLCPRALFAFSRHRRPTAQTEIWILVSAFPSGGNWNQSEPLETQISMELSVDYGEKWAESPTFEFVKLSALKWGGTLLLHFHVPDRRAQLWEVSVVNGNALAAALTPTERLDLLRSRLLSSVCFYNRVAEGTFRFLEVIDTLEHTDGTEWRALVLPDFFSRADTTTPNGEIFVNLLSAGQSGLHLRLSEVLIPTYVPLVDDDPRVGALVAAVSILSVLMCVCSCLCAWHRWCWKRNRPLEGDWSELNTKLTELFAFLQLHGNRSPVSEHDHAHDYDDPLMGIDVSPSPSPPHASLLAAGAAGAPSATATTSPSRFPRSASHVPNVSLAFSED